MATSDIPQPGPTLPPRINPPSVFRWCFESRDTGRITIAQMPNGPLWLFLAALVVELVFHPTGHLGLAVRILKVAGLTIWAIDEIIRGCNPWRRALGTGVLIFELYAWIAS